MIGLALTVYKFFRSPFGQIVGIGLLILLAVGSYRTWLFVHDREIARSARAKAVREMVVATAKESERRQAVIVELQADAQRVADDLASERERNNTLLQEIANASAANDARVCLDDTSLNRLRRLQGGDRQPAGSGTQPRRAPGRTQAPLPPSRPAVIGLGRSG